MTRGIFIVLLLIALIAGGALYYIQQGPGVLMKSPTVEKLAFVSDRGGNRDVWVMNADGADPLNITGDSADDQMPAWSPDGKELVLTSDKVGNTYQVYVASWAGKYKNQMTVSTGAKDMPVWRRDGEEIAFICSGKVFTVGKHGGQEEQFLPSHESPDLGAMDGELNSYLYAAWSSDGKEMLGVQMSDQGKKASVNDLRTSGGAKPVDILRAHDVDASWSPAGKQVALAFIDSGGKNGIVLFNYESMDARSLILTKGNTLGYTKPVWSPDGGMLVFEEWALVDGLPQKSVGIYSIKISGGKPVLIASGDARQPCISPDGMMIAYTLAGKDGKRDIMRCDIDGKNPVDLTKGQGDNYDPAWSPLPAKR